MGTEHLLHAALTERIIASFYKVYNTLGFGFLERIYANSLAVELGMDGMVAKREVPVRILYRGVDVGTYRFDMLVDRSIVVEVKSAVALGPADDKQLTNYLRASDLEVGLLLNFGPKPKVRRLVLTNAFKREEAGQD